MAASRRVLIDLALPDRGRWDCTVSIFMPLFQRDQELEKGSAASAIGAPSFTDSPTEGCDEARGLTLSWKADCPLTVSLSFRLPIA